MGILVVDDSKVARQLLVKLLEDMGFPVMETFSSAEALIQRLAVIDPNSVDAILLDIILPGMDGISCCRLVKEMEAFKTTPVLLVTGSDGEQHMRDGFDAGADDYITKPIKRHELQVRLRLALRLNDETKTRRKYEMRLRDDILVAQEVQRRLLTRQLRGEGILMELLHKPAVNLSGDMVYACRTGENRYALLLLDVMGHGVAAAFVAVFLHSAAQELFAQDPDPGTVLTSLARNMWDLSTLALQDGGPSSGVFPSFFTAVCLFMDLENKRLRWFNAGHVPVLLALDDGQVMKLESTSPPLGVFSDVRLRSEKMALPEHCRLLAFSDGVLDNYFTSPSEGLAWFSGRLNMGRNESVAAFLSALGNDLEPRRLAGEMDDLCVALMDLSCVKNAREAT